ncbi:MAG: hypothetical protein ACLFQH_07500 [Halothiobacillaceae bacterium]
MKNKVLKNAVALVVGLGLSTVAWSAETLCFELKPQESAPVTSLVYKLQVTDKGDGVFDLQGRSRAISANEPVIETWRVVSGVAATMPDGLEVSIVTSDIADWRSTVGIEETLHTSDVHMLLDLATFEGTFHAVNFSHNTNPQIPDLTTGLNGTAGLVTCPF